MDKNLIGNPQSEIFLVFDELEIISTEKVQLFYNTITKRHTNKELLFYNDFCITSIKYLKENKIDINAVKLILVSSRDYEFIEKLISRFKFQKSNLINWDLDDYSFFDNFSLNKILLQVDDFYNLESDIIQQIVSDLVYINSCKSNLFSEDGLFGLSNTVFYQFSCQKCGYWNLFVNHRYESGPKFCKKCNHSIYSNNQDFNTELLILDNDNLETIYPKKIDYERN